MARQERQDKRQDKTKGDVIQDKTKGDVKQDKTIKASHNDIRKKARKHVISDDTSQNTKGDGQQPFTITTKGDEKGNKNDDQKTRQERRYKAE